MYRVYQLTEEETGKITRLRWDGDTHYWDVFESEQELEAEEARLKKIEEDYRRNVREYIAMAGRLI